MKKIVRGLMFIAAIAAVPTLAHAQTYDVAGDYGNGVFSYGLGVNGSTFSPYTQSYGSGCAGLSQLACKTSTNSEDPNAPNLDVPDLPTVLINNGPGTANVYTVSIPTGLLLLHPGDAAVGEDSILRFIAATAGTYTFNGTVSRLDTTANGNGVLYSLFANGIAVGGALLSTTSGSQALAYTGYLGAGQAFSFGVNNNGEVGFDSTGLAATIAAVPEPATWAMMLLGFGIAGAALRRRRRVNVAYA